MLSVPQQSPAVPGPEIADVHAQGPGAARAERRQSSASCRLVVEPLGASVRVSASRFLSEVGILPWSADVAVEMAGRIKQIAVGKKSRFRSVQLTFVLRVRLCAGLAGSTRARVGVVAHRSLDRCPTGAQQIVGHAQRVGSYSASAARCRWARSGARAPRGRAERICTGVDRLAVVVANAHVHRQLAGWSTDPARRRRSPSRSPRNSMAHPASVIRLGTWRAEPVLHARAVHARGRCPSSRYRRF